MAFLQLNAVEQHRKVRARHAGRSTGVLAGKAEGPLLQPLLVEPPSIAVPLQKSNAVPRAVEEGVDATVGEASEGTADDGGDPIVVLAEVHRAAV